MRLNNILQFHVNKAVEVFTDNGYFEGELVSVGDTSMVIQNMSGYGGPTSSLNILLAKVNYVRVLNS